jgi:hypothetical protein
MLRANALISMIRLRKGFKEAEVAEIMKTMKNIVPL